MICFLKMYPSYHKQNPSKSTSVPCPVAHRGTHWFLRHFTTIQTHSRPSFLWVTQVSATPSACIYMQCSAGLYAEQTSRCRRYPLHFSAVHGTRWSQVKKTKKTCTTTYFRHKTTTNSGHFLQEPLTHDSYYKPREYAWPSGVARI